jgi:hypothetical protein
MRIRGGQWPSHLFLALSCLLALALEGMRSSVAWSQIERLPPPIDAEMPPLLGGERIAWSNGASAQPDAGKVESPMTDRLLADDEWAWQVLPQGLIYRSYLAGTKEPRLASVWNHDNRIGWMWDLTLGGRVGLLRYGTFDPLFPKGWELDMEGAAILRLNLDDDRDLVATDFRAGFPLTFSFSRWEHKFAYYHLSSHIGDEYLVENPMFQRINYSRDALVWGSAFRWTPNVRLYAEVGYAVYADGGSEPWETQFGVEYSPMIPNGFRPLPFLAINGALREDRNWSGNFVAQTGIQWRGYTGHLFRFGVEYYNGLSRQFEFFDQFEQQVGLGIWFDY